MQYVMSVLSLVRMPLLCNTQVRKLSEHGLSAALGAPSADFWDIICTNYGGSERRPSLGVMLYGDEAEALGTSFMTIG